MNITPSNAASNTGLQPAASGTAQISTGIAAGGVDAPVDPSSSAPGFGAILTIHLADGRDEYATTNGGRHGARGPTDLTDAADAAPDVDAKAAAVVTRADPATLTVAAPPNPQTGLVAPSSASSGSDAVRHDAADKDRSEDAVDGSAAQLAVISQWAAFASPSSAVPDASLASAATGAATRAATSLVAGNAVATRSGLDAQSGDRAIGVAGNDDGVSKAGKPEVAGGSSRPDAGRDAVQDPASDVLQDRMQDAVRSFTANGESTMRQEHRSSSSDDRKPIAVAAAAQATASSSRAGAAKTASDLATATLASIPTFEQATSQTLNTNTTVAIGSLFATRLASAGSPSTAPASASPTIATSLHEAVGTGAWSNEVGQVALKMATTDLQSASLRLNPEHLGPLDVQVRVDNGVAHVAFNAAHAETRQALEASRTTLDQMFGSQGIRMGDVSVGAGAADTSSGRGQQAGGAQADTARRDGGSRWSAGGSTGDADAGTTVTARVSRTVGLVDTFA